MSRQDRHELHCYLVDTLLKWSDIDKSTSSTLNRYHFIWILSEDSINGEREQRILGLARCTRLSSRDIHKTVRDIAQYKLPGEVEALILDFSESYYMINGKKNSKGSGVQALVKEIMREALDCIVRMAGTQLDTDRADYLISLCVTQALQQKITKRQKKIEGKPGPGPMAIKEFKDELIAMIYKEYGRKDGWRFPLFTRSGDDGPLQLLDQI